MVSAGLVIEMSMVKSTSSRFKPGLRAPAALEGGTFGCWGRAGAGKCDGAASGVGEKGKGGNRAWGHLSFPVTHNDSAEKPRSPGR